MKYCSTRGSSTQTYTPSEAITQGLAPDGGLFVPLTIPAGDNLISCIAQADSYAHRAAMILEIYLQDFTPEEVESCSQAAYGFSQGRFSHLAVAPLIPLTDKEHILELWHGPTCAFKDMALQILPYLLKKAAGKAGETAELVILTATSGDTGKAALEGFRDIPGIKVIVFYPADGVSEMQRRQMVTQEGSNVHVVAVRGNFDDAQTGVKAIFSDQALAQTLSAKGFKFTSANSINWGRLAPQIAYYWSVYGDLLRQKAVGPGEKVNFVVPTGNFGNILAGFYALKMGLPVGRLICASNKNNVLTDFINTGIYQRSRPFHRTISPSMDILISSNLERLLYHLSGGEGQQIKNWMEQLQTSGSYQVGGELFAAVSEIFKAGWADDDETTAVIKNVYRDHGYLMDPHSAVAKAVYNKYKGETGDTAPAVIVSTASPFKFNESVAAAVLDPSAVRRQSEFQLLETLAEATGLQIPRELASLEQKPELHSSLVSREDMPGEVLRFLGLQ